MVKLRLEREIENKKLQWELQRIELKMMVERETAAAEAHKTKLVNATLLFESHL